MQIVVQLDRVDFKMLIETRVSFDVISKTQSINNSKKIHLVMDDARFHFHTNSCLRNSHEILLSIFSISSIGVRSCALPASDNSLTQHHLPSSLCLSKEKMASPLFFSLLHCTHDDTFLMYRFFSVCGRSFFFLLPLLHDNKRKCGLTHPTDSFFPFVLVTVSVKALVFLSKFHFSPVCFIKKSTVGEKHRFFFLLIVKCPFSVGKVSGVSTQFMYCRTV